jgi:integrase
VDPLEQRDTDAKAAAADAQRAKVKAITFKDVAEKYMDAHEAGLSNAKHKTQWRNTMSSYAYPVMGALPVAEVETGHVLAVLEPIWRTKPETAVRVRGRIESILDYARALDWRAGENPARWKGHLSNTLPARGKIAPAQHHPALPWPQIGGFYAALVDHPGVGALALQFAVLTAARSGEVLGAVWSEIDLAAKVWTIPGERMKAGKEHRVPLSVAALAVLETAQALRTKAIGDEHVFPGAYPGRPLTNMAMRMVLRRMKAPDGKPWSDEKGEEVVPHGFRSTFRDWAAERTSYPNEVVEMALAHAIDDKTEAAYRRGDLFEKRARLMREWGKFCTTPAQAKSAENVTSLRVGGA